MGVTKTNLVVLLVQETLVLTDASALGIWHWLLDEVADQQLWISWPTVWPTNPQLLRPRPRP